MQIGLIWRRPVDLVELRRHDYTLEEVSQEVLVAFGDFFRDQCPSSLVRASEPLGFSQDLWDRLVEMGTTTMGLPESVGGDGAGMVELALVAEEFGRAIAPVPFIEHVVTSRALARANNPALAEVIAQAADGSRILALASAPVMPGTAQLVPAGAIAKDVLAMVGDALVLFSAPTPPAHVPNQGSTPLAWWDLFPLAQRTIVATGQTAQEIYTRAHDERMVLTASALVGLTEYALGLTIEFAKTRETMGVLIATLQGVAFPLTDIATNIAGARNIARKAAWFLDFDPSTRPDLPAIALVYASQTATHGTQQAAHLQGGLGFTVENDISMYFLRSKGWGSLAGDPTAHLASIGQHVLTSVI